MNDFDFIEDYDFEEMEYSRCCDAPTKEELEFYRWFKENPQTPTQDVVKRMESLSRYSFIRKTSVSMLRELLRMDLSHCSHEHDESFQKAEAIRLFMEGESMTHSRGICESDTQGYGRLGHYGYWEHPISEADIQRAETDEDWCMRKGRLP